MDARGPDDMDLTRSRAGRRWTRPLRVACLRGIAALRGMSGCPLVQSCCAGEPDVQPLRERHDVRADRGEQRQGVLLLELTDGWEAGRSGVA